MSLVQLTHLLTTISNIPGLSVAGQIAVAIYNNIQTVQDHQSECDAIFKQSVQLILALHDCLQDQAAQVMSDALHEAEGVLEHTAKKTREWSGKGRVAKFFKSGDFGRDLSTLKIELDTCVTKYQMLALAHLAREQNKQTAGLEHIAREQNLESQVLVRLLEGQTTLLTKSDENLLAVNDMNTVLGSLQSEIRQLARKPDPDNDLKNAFSRGLNTISKASGTMPPLTDLTGQVEKLRAESGGRSVTIWRGVLWGQQEVAIVGLREFSANNVARVERFQREADLWRKLQHPNVLRCLGFATDLGDSSSPANSPTDLGDSSRVSISLISPWMRNRDVMTYIYKHPDCNRKRILGEAALGLKYLHDNRFVHGALRGENILVDDNGGAKLCDFGLSAIELDAANSSGSAAGLALRWLAPERMTSSEEGPIGHWAESDIFSYGRAVLEIMTGQHPWAEEKNMWAIPGRMERGYLPKRPEGQVFVARGLTDEVWNFLLRTWQYQPERRPKINEVVAKVQSFGWIPVNAYAAGA